MIGKIKLKINDRFPRINKKINGLKEKILIPVIFISFIFFLNNLLIIIRKDLPHKKDKL